MSRIAQAFAHGKAFIPFLTCGDPDLETTEAAVRPRREPTSSSWESPSPTPPPRDR